MLPTLKISMQEGKTTKNTEDLESKKAGLLSTSSSSNPFLNASETYNNPFKSNYKHPLSELPPKANPFIVTPSVTSASLIQREEKKETPEQKESKEKLGNISNVTDIGKNISAEIEDANISTDKFNIALAKNGFGFLTEFSKKMQNGASFDEAVLGALLKVGIDHTTGSDKFKAIVKGKSPNGKLGILVSTLKTFGYTKAADILDIASKMSSRGLVGQGIVEGFTGLFDLIYSGGDEEKLEKMRKNQIKGDYGPITQGYSILAALISSLALRDAREMEEISSKAGRGELGTLPEIGDKLGSVVYDTQARVKETRKNNKTDDKLRTTSTAHFEKLSAYEKFEAIHHLITGYTSKEDVDAIIRIMSTVKSKADRDLICEQYLQKTYQLDRYSLLTIENVLKIRDYKDERQGGMSGKFEIQFKLNKSLTSSRNFSVTEGRVNIEIMAKSKDNTTKYEIELFERGLFSNYTQKVSLTADGRAYTYQWRGVPVGQSFDFRITTEEKIEGKAKINLG